MFQMISEPSWETECLHFAVAGLKYWSEPCQSYQDQKEAEQRHPCKKDDGIMIHHKCLLVERSFE